MKGCSTRTVNGWTVNRVHYSADPEKDPATEAGKKWVEDAQRGVRKRDWRQEYEIDYRARSGQPVFPEIDENIHKIKPFILAPGAWTVYLGADPHPRTAHAFVWLAINKFGEKVVPWSWWPQEQNDELEGLGKPRLTVADYAKRLKLVDKSGLNLEPWRSVMDQAGKIFNASEGVDYFQKYREENVYFEPAKKNRDLSGYDSISEALKLEKFEDGEYPGLTIMEGCGDNDELFRQLRDLRFREWRGIVTDKDAPEEVEQKKRHLVDCLSYILLDGPEFVPIGKQRNYPVQYPKIGW
jgi:hypothetical protein